jgi:hypothetical protein
MSEHGINCPLPPDMTAHIRKIQESRKAFDHVEKRLWHGVMIMKGSCMYNEKNMYIIFDVFYYFYVKQNL